MGMYEDLLINLTNSSCQLEDIFLKLKVLAIRLKNSQLKSFVDFELNGYNDIDVLPACRKISGILKGDVENPFCRRKGIVLPTLHLKNNIIDDIQTCYFLNKIAELENYAKGDDLNKPIPPEYYNMLSKVFDNGYCVTNAYVPISSTKIKGVLSGIRNAVLDLIMSMEEQFTQAELEAIFHNPTKEQINKANLIINQFFITSVGSSTQNTKIELQNDK